MLEKLNDLNNIYLGMYRYAPYDESIHLIIDIETAGTKVYSKEEYIVFSIGCSVWVPNEYGILKIDDELKFYEVINREDSKRLGFKEDPAIMDWWIRKTSEEVKNSTLKGGKPVKDVLELFIDFLFSIVNKYPKKTNYVWGNAPEFDISYIYKYFKRLYNIGYLFPFWITRDVRTLNNQVFIEKEKLFEIYNDKNMVHNAYYDTISEGKIISEVITNAILGNKLLEEKLNNIEKETNN